jgi:Dissimilatory sulfite reductase (desulfoviridin), gamma subunit
MERKSATVSTCTNCSLKALQSSLRASPVCQNPPSVY